MSEHLCCVHVFLLRCQTVTVCTSEASLSSLSPYFALSIWVVPQGTRPLTANSFTASDILDSFCLLNPRRHISKHAVGTSSVPRPGRLE